jgi:hypothetical protein
MPTRVEVTAAELVTPPKGEPHWQVSLKFTAEDDTTSMIGWAFPHDQLEWRAAEYDIDHTDTHALMDLCLGEALLTATDWETGTQLYTAPNIPTARADHVARCQAALKRHGITPSRNRAAAADPLEQIRTDSPMDPEVIAIKAENVDRIRQAQAEQAAAVDVAVDRAELYRTLLFGPPVGPRTDIPNPAVPDPAAELDQLAVAPPPPAEPDPATFPWPAGPVD